MKKQIAILITGLILSMLIIGSAFAATDNLAYDSNSNPIVTYNPEDINMQKMSFKEGQSIPLSGFFKSNKKSASMYNGSEVRIIKTSTDNDGISHHRAIQYYKGFEIDNVQFLLHEKSGKIFHAHGNLMSELELRSDAMITESKAYKIALTHLETGSVLWKKPAELNKKMSSKKSVNQGKLLFTSGRKSQKPENLKLVYRFDIVTMKPLGRYQIDIDAQTGELINKADKMYEGDIISYGESLYHDIVPITLSDEDFPLWLDSTNWHTDSWNSFGNSGASWWVGDTSLGKNGGYDNHWYEVLETPPIVLSGLNQKLNFYHRYAVEEPEVYEEYDGWDGMNVRISTDSGKTWSVLNNPSVPYTCSSLFSFGGEHGEGPDIPGWAGKLEQWKRVTFDLSNYKDDTVIIRFAFASDPAYSTVDGDEALFGWQIDNISISNNFGNLLFDDGINTHLIPENISQDVRLIEGNYRLREIGRGGGISTYDASDIESYSASVDFVSDEIVFSQVSNQAGVTAHWAQEATYDYFLNFHGRKSYDDNNGRLIAYVNWNSEEDINNASWIGFASVYGAGDKQIFNPFSDLDVVAHEITHGVTEHSAGLIYENEPGALNESFSDIFGIAVEIEELGLQDDSWLIGEKVSISGSALRSMRDPNSRGDPDTYKGAFWKMSTSDPSSENDWGGVHHNSGVQNYWFYLLSMGGFGINDDGISYSVSGIGINDAAKIAYRNLTLYLQPTSGYMESASYSALAATDLFGENSIQVQSVVDAWNAVGVYFTPKIHVPSLVEFQTSTGQSTDRSIQIYNRGLQDLTIDNIQLAGTQFQLQSASALPVTLAPGDFLDLNVTFSALTENEETGMINLYSDDPFEPVKEISLIGNPENPTQLIPLTGFSSGFELYQNFPNPFSNETTIQYYLNRESSVLLRIYNLSGEEVRTLVQQRQPEGLHSILWDGTNKLGNRVSTGMYIYTFQTDEITSSKRLLIQ